MTGPEMKNWMAWNPPEAEAEGDPDPHQIYAAVGRALTEWNKAEEAIAYLFAVFVDTGSVAGPAMSAYAQVWQVSNRVRMVQGASEAWFTRHPECPYQDQTKGVLNACTKWSARRNELAHGAVDLPADGAVARYFLYPNYFTTARPIRGNSKYRYTANQIRAFAHGFESLNGEINSLFTAIDVWKARNLLNKKGTPPA